MRSLIFSVNIIYIMFFIMSASRAWASWTTGVALTGVNLRESPRGKKIPPALPKGKVFKVLGRDLMWTQVELDDGRRGYVFNRYVRVKSSFVRPIAIRRGPFAFDDQKGQSDPEPVVGLCEGTTTQPLEAQVIRLLKPLAEAPSLYSRGEDSQKDGTHSSLGSCLTERLVVATKKVWKTQYGASKKSRGECAEAIRTALHGAGIWSQGHGIGNAKDMIPGLQKMGFKNRIRPGITPENAPPRSLLVYGAARKKRGCSGLGATFGHVELKESNNSYLYDTSTNHSIQRSYYEVNGRRIIRELQDEDCRPLIGVMVMGDSCPTCTTKALNECGWNKDESI